MFFCSKLSLKALILENSKQNVIVTNWEMISLSKRIWFVCLLRRAGWWGGRFKSSFAENIFSGFGLSEYFLFLYLHSFKKHLQNITARELFNKWTFKLHWDALIHTVWEIVVFALHTVEDKRKTHCKCQSISRYILDTIYCNGHRISPATVGTEKYSEHFYSLNCLLK